MPKTIMVPGKEELKNKTLEQKIDFLCENVVLKKDLFDAEQRIYAEMDENFALVAEQFRVIDERFDGIDERLDGIDERLDGIDERLDGIDERLDGIDERLDGIDEKLFQHDLKVIQIDQRLGFHDIHFAEIDKRFDKLAIDMFEFKSEIISHVDNFVKVTENLEIEVSSLKNRVDYIESKID